MLHFSIKSNLLTCREQFEPIWYCISRVAVTEWLVCLTAKQVVKAQNLDHEPSHLFLHSHPLSHLVEIPLPHILFIMFYLLHM